MGVGITQLAQPTHSKRLNGMAVSGVDGSPSGGSRAVTLGAAQGSTTSPIDTDAMSQIGSIRDAGLARNASIFPVGASSRVLTLARSLSPINVS